MRRSMLQKKHQGGEKGGRATRANDRKVGKKSNSKLVEKGEDKKHHILKTIDDKKKMYEKSPPPM